MTNARATRLAALQQACRQRILVLDGAIGTQLQDASLEEADFRGQRFADHGADLKGNLDVLNLTAPDTVAGVHDAYFAADADFATTNTFTATRVSQADYGLEAHVLEINRRGAEIARAVAERWNRKTPERPRYVLGSLGPTNRTASLSPDVNDPGYRNVTFDDLVASYGEAARGLVEGGADLLIVETIFDTLNAKAALFALDELFEEIGERLPLIVSGTITDLSGRTLSGQTVEAFWNSIRHGDPFAVGLNCALGAEQLRQYVAELSRFADLPISVHPNAGLPNQFGEYEETPETTAAHLGAWAGDGLVNLVGGCCGTTPAHIRAIAAAIDGKPPREVPTLAPAMRLSGLEAVTIAA